MSFALGHQNIKGKAGDSKTLATKNNNLVSHNHRITTLNRDSPDYILHLQRTIGNHAVQRLLCSSVKFDFGKIGIQPKLKISHPNDPYEREADTIAEEVMRMSAPSDPVAPITAARNQHRIDRKCEACEMEAEREESKEDLEISQKSETTQEFTNEIHSIRSSRSAEIAFVTVSQPGYMDEQEADGIWMEM